MKNLTAKQKKSLYRCIMSFILVVALSVTFHLVKVNRWLELVLYLVPYFIVGYDVLLKAA